ncbi:Os03g0283650 [Oryza sativa Japonica Group]|uniref:Os03g0283650 protein n=1 Tax=Oryza sativa subsp. japonica TaxID=39947 RepID=A0A0P0VW71_ORYSJ|nr:Os03g0283650 [Oryza sativa Japonica Group]
MVSTVGSVSSLGGGGCGAPSFATPFTAGATTRLLLPTPSDPIPSPPPPPPPECGKEHRPLTGACAGGGHRNQRHAAVALVAVAAAVVVVVGR